MKDFIRTYARTMAITGIIILLPMLFGMVMWNQLPDQIATHFDYEGTPDGYSSKAFAVFGLPLFILAMQWLCLLGTGSDPKRKNLNSKVLRLMLWVCPVVSVFCSAGIYAHALGVGFNMTLAGTLFVSLVFIIVGNYLPKCRQNYTMGIKLPWTLADEDNWNKTHRFGGFVFILCGVLILLAQLLLPARIGSAVMFVLMIAAALIPTVYSYLYARKKGQL